MEEKYLFEIWFKSDIYPDYIARPLYVISNNDVNAKSLAEGGMNSSFEVDRVVRIARQYSKNMFG